MYRLNLTVTPLFSIDPAFTVQRRLVKMFLNFLNPTPTLLDPLIDVTWPPLTTNKECMDIGENLTTPVHPNRARMDVWHAFDQQFINLHAKP